MREETVPPDSGAPPSGRGEARTHVAEDTCGGLFRVAHLQHAARYGVETDG